MTSFERREPAEGTALPSYAPLLLAFGSSFLFAGITMHWLFAAVGALVVAEALRRWMTEIMRQWRRSPSSVEGGTIARPEVPLGDSP